jgi:16S rRNA (guanine(527)-N(7))-methyltransferase RsmG
LSQFLNVLRQLAADSGANSDLISRLASADLCAGLDRHQSLLKQWNPKINLTRVIEDDASAKKHFLESLLASSLIEPSETEVADLGSGAGFPGIPIGMLWPEIHVTLLESDIRKSIFLKEVTREHSNFKVEAVRGNSFALRTPRPRIHLVISRAVMWPDLSALAIAFDCPLLWITSEAEYAKADTEMFHVEQRKSLPGGAGIAIRMCHVEHQPEVLR